MRPHHAVLALLALPLAGCEAVMAVNAVSVATTDKDLASHALGAVTGKDCRIVEGLVQADRAVCEAPAEEPGIEVVGPPGRDSAARRRIWTPPESDAEPPDGRDEAAVAPGSRLARPESRRFPRGA